MEVLMASDKERDDWNIRQLNPWQPRRLTVFMTIHPAELPS